MVGASAMLLSVSAPPPGFSGEPTMTCAARDEFARCKSSSFSALPSMT